MAEDFKIDIADNLEKPDDENFKIGKIKSTKHSNILNQINNRKNTIPNENKNILNNNGLNE